ncbi:MAG: RNA polymerase sigma factor [Eubacteriaceae bacterium]|nr:RNA polymerase sigma factor [Eubacteriaceae bacterium]
MIADSGNDKQNNQIASGLIERYYPEILRYCLRLTARTFMAQDAAQETFLKVVRFSDKITFNEKFRALLYKIAANTCIDMKRKRHLQDLPIEEALPLPCEETGYDEVNSQDAFGKMISPLNDEARHLITLRFESDLSLRQISEITGMPLRTVQSKIRAALKLLKERITKEEIERKTRI